MDYTGSNANNRMGTKKAVKDLALAPYSPRRSQQQLLLSRVSSLIHAK